MEVTKQTLPYGRARLSAVISAAGDVVGIDDAVRVLNISRTQASKLLSRWATQGWLKRIGTGAYVPVPLDMLNAEQIVQDPWILVPVLFSPGYIGGRTAAEHWDLTEQIFRDVFVFTARSFRTKTLERQGTIFTLAHIREDLIFGTKTVWRGQSKIAVSDVHRTIIDMIADPSIGGGIQHVADCFERYLQRSDSKPETLIDYADRLGNGAVFKRLGYLAELYQGDTILKNVCKNKLTQGHALLDPALNCDRLVTRWRLRVPENWIKKKGKK